MLPCYKTFLKALARQSQLQKHWAPMLGCPKTRGITKFQICKIVIQASDLVSSHQPLAKVQKLFIKHPWQHATGSPGGYIKCPVSNYGKVAVLTVF